MFINRLNCTLGKRNQVRLCWNRAYDNVPEAKNDEFDTFVGRKLLPLRLSVFEDLNETYARQV